MIRRWTWEAAPFGLAKALKPEGLRHVLEGINSAEGLNLGESALAELLESFERAFAGTVLQPRAAEAAASLAHVSDARSREQMVHDQIEQLLQRVRVTPSPPSVEPRSDAARDPEAGITAKMSSVPLPPPASPTAVAILLDAYKRRHRWASQVSTESIAERPDDSRTSSTRPGAIRSRSFRSGTIPSLRATRASMGSRDDGIPRAPTTVSSSEAGGAPRPPLAPVRSRAVGWNRSEVEQRACTESVSGPGSRSGEPSTVRARRGPGRGGSGREGSGETAEVPTDRLSRGMVSAAPGGARASMSARVFPPGVGADSAVFHAMERVAKRVEQLSASVAGDALFENSRALSGGAYVARSAKPPGEPSRTRGLDETLSALLDALPARRSTTQRSTAQCASVRSSAPATAESVPSQSVESAAPRSQFVDVLGVFDDFAATKALGAGVPGGIGPESGRADARAGAHLAVDWFGDEDLEERITAILRAQVKRHGLEPL